MGSGRHDAGQGAGKGQGHRKDTQGRQGRRAPRRAATERMEWSGARSASVGAAKGMETGTGRIRVPALQARAQVTGGRTHCADRGTKAWGLGRVPRARSRVPWAPWDRQDGAREPRGEDGAKGGGTGGGAPQQQDMQPVRCIPPGIQQMPAHHTHHHHDHHALLFNIDSDAGDLIPPPNPPTRAPASPPRAEGGAGADGCCLGGGGRAQRRRRRHRGWRGSRRGGERGPGPGTGTGTRSQTPLGVRPPSCWWRCTGG